MPCPHPPMVIALIVLALGGAPSAPAQPSAPAWAMLEAPTLVRHTRLMSPDRFLSVGNARFNPGVGWLNFQAVLVPPPPDL